MRKDTLSKWHSLRGIGIHYDMFNYANQVEEILKALGLKVEAHAPDKNPESHHLVTDIRSYRVVNDGAVSRSTAGDLNGTFEVCALNTPLLRLDKTLFSDTGVIWIFCDNQLFLAECVRKWGKDKTVSFVHPELPKILDRVRVDEVCKKDLFMTMLSWQVYGDIADSVTLHSKRGNQVVDSDTFKALCKMKMDIIPRSARFVWHLADDRRCFAYLDGYGVVSVGVRRASELSKLGEIWSRLNDYKCLGLSEKSPFGRLRTLDLFSPGPADGE